MSLRVLPSKVAIPNSLEEKYNIATNAYWPQMVEQLNLGWAGDKKGRLDRSSFHYQAGNYYTYLFHYALIVSNYIQANLSGDCSEEDFTRVMDEVECLFKISCVEKNLSCLSNNLGIDLVSLWKYFKEMFNINCNCQEFGIDEMIINLNDCSAFIVGQDT